jgi:hypothetical protein
MPTREAMEFDSCMQMIRNRFGDMPVDQQEKIVRISAGYGSNTYSLLTLSSVTQTCGGDRDSWAGELRWAEKPDV